MASANDIRKGIAIRHNGSVCLVLDFIHKTPGNLRATVQATLRNLETGKTSPVRFTSTSPIEIVNLTRLTLEYSYKDQTGYTFMDPKTYESVTLNEELVGDAKNYLIENLPCEILFNDGRPVTIDLPSSVKLKVLEAPPGIRGDTATNVTKPVKVETGIMVNAPIFINAGEVIKVDTRTGAYMSRA
jgi:elongation factor P